VLCNIALEYVGVFLMSGGTW